MNIIVWYDVRKQKLLIHSQVDVYELRIRSFTTIYDPVYGRIHAIYAPYTTVFWRITWSSITVVYLRDRIRSYTEKNGGRERSYLDPYTIV